MPTIILEIPDDVLRGSSPEQFGRDLRLAAALFWYLKGDQQETVARVAGLNLAEFRRALWKEGLETKPQEAEDSKGAGAGADRP